MADGGAENLRKQIAFLSNLIDSHKSAKYEENPVPKRISNLKQNTSWSRWKTEGTIHKNKTQNKQLNQRQQGNMILNGTLSRNIQNAPNVKGHVSNKLSYRKVCTNKAAQLSSSRLQMPNTPTNITSGSRLNISTMSSLQLQNKGRSLQKPASKITTQFHVSQLTNQQKSDQKIKYKLHRKITSTKSAPPSSSGHIFSFNTTDQKVLTKIPLSTSYSGFETPFKAVSVNSSSGHSIKQQRSNARQPMVKLKWTKNENIYSRLPDSKSTAEKAGTSSNRIVVKPLTKNPLLSSFRHVKPLTKTVSLPATYTRNSSDHSFQNSTSTLDRITLLQKTHRTNSEATTNLAKSTVQSAVIPDGAKFKWRRKSTSQLRKDSCHKPSKTHRTNAKAVVTSSKIISATKSSIEPAVISQGAKLKWRRKSASQRGKDSKKNPKSKNLFGNDLQTRMALKSKWQRSKPSSTIRRNTVNNTSGNHLIRASVNHVPKNASGKRVIQSQHTKNILQLRTFPGRARLKWSKTLLQTTKNDQSSARKMKFAYKSRFSLKRRKSSEGKSLGVNRGSLGSSRVQHGAINRVKNQNRGFVARRMKYIALGSHTKNKSFASKYSLTKNAQLRRKVTIGGNHYVISSHGKTLQKTMPINKTKSSTVAHISSLHVYRKPVAVSSTNTIHRIFKRQISVNKSKTKTANKILKRTLQNVQAVMKKVKKQKSDEYCMFYNKFGKCTKQKQGVCPYIHDPTKIAVCTRFLRGKCQQMDGTCPFSHKIDKEKMPICQYFLKGKCNRDDCPYSHVNVGRQAVLCEDFLKGYCALGFKCKKKHVLECEEFSTTGQCPNGNKCRLIHRKKVQQRKRYFDKETLALDEEDNVRDLKKARRRSSDGFLPLEGSTISEDECVNVTHVQTHKSQEETGFGVCLRIRPNFTSKESSHEEQ